MILFVNCELGMEIIWFPNVDISVYDTYIHYSPLIRSDLYIIPYFKGPKYQNKYP